MAAQPNPGASVVLSTGPCVHGRVCKPHHCTVHWADVQGTTATLGFVDSVDNRSVRNVKEHCIPEQLVASVAELQSHIKRQESVYVDVSHTAPKPLVQVQDGIATLKHLLSVLNGGIRQNCAALLRLKGEMAQELQNVEMAHHTRETSAGHHACNEYFTQLLRQFEEHMATYRQQIEAVEKHACSMQQPGSASPVDTLTLIRTQHQSFIALAGRLHTTHNAVKAQIEQYKALKARCVDRPSGSLQGTAPWYVQQ